MIFLPPRLSVVWNPSTNYWTDCSRSYLASQSFRTSSSPLFLILAPPMFIVTPSKVSPQTSVSSPSLRSAPICCFPTSNSH